MFTAIWAGAVDVLVDRGYDVRRHFASTQNGIQVSLFLVGEAFVDFRGLRIDFAKAPQHWSVAAVFGLCSGPGCGL